MPFIVVFGSERSPAKRRRLVAGVTEAVATAFECPPDVVTVYFPHMTGADYGHGGAYGSAASVQRTFVQVHVLPRPVEKKRRLVKGVAEAVAASYGLPIERVAVYIYDRAPHDISHGGVLFSDQGQAHYDPSKAF